MKKNCYQINTVKIFDQTILFWIASLIKPCWPTSISLKKLTIPIQITGLISTPPIGGIIFLVKYKIELVGIEINIQKPLFKSIFGYQVNINLIKKASVKNDKKIPNVKSKIDK